MGWPRSDCAALPGPVSAAVGAGVGFLIVQVLFVWLYEAITGRRGMGEGDAKLLLMIGAFLGWEAVLFSLLAGSVQGLIVAGIAMATGAPLIPKRPDDLEEAAEASPDSVDPAQADAVVSIAPAGPPMMVFGPMLALGALEYSVPGRAHLERTCQLVLTAEPRSE